MKDELYIQALLERFVKGKATAKEQKEVQQLCGENPDIKAQLEFMQVLHQGLVQGEVNRMSQRLSFLTSQLKQNKKKQSFLDTLNQQLNYTLEQLLQLFAPVPAYQTQLARISLRAAATDILLSPPTSYDCVDYQLQFSLEKPLSKTEELELIVEDNQFNEVYAQEYPPQTTEFTVQLNPNDYAPGRYYWKLSVEDQLLIGEFFIQKDLMPE